MSKIQKRLEILDIFNVKNCPATLKFYSDYDIINDYKIDRNYFDSYIFNIKNFNIISYNDIYTKLITFDGYENGYIKEWYNWDMNNYNNNTEIIQFCCTIPDGDYEYGWCVRHISNSHDISVGCYYGHSFVKTNDFLFENSDGSNFEEVNYKNIDIETVKDYIIMKSNKYIFDQLH